MNSFKLYVSAIILISALTAKKSYAVNYYIDSSAGVDANNGTSTASPWKNLTRINGVTFLPGDNIYLKSGSIWNGQQLKFVGSGTTSSPIIIDQYGTGAKPKINGDGLVGEGVVYLYNQDNIEINNLEITNYPILLLYANSTAYTLNQIVYNGIFAYRVTVAGTTATTGGAPTHTSGTGISGSVTFTYYCKLTNTTYPNNMFFAGVTDHPSETNPRSDNPLGADRRGVMVAIKDDGVANHIYLKNLNIHHIKGQLGNGQLTINGAIPKRTAGIYFTVLNENSSSNSRYNDVLIDGCEINYVENTGLGFDNEDNVYYPGGNELALWTARRFTNIKVSNNVIHHIGKNAMILRCTDETGLIERNVCYETAVGTTGNTMFSARAKGTIFQYNEGYFNRSTTQQVDPGDIDGSMYDPDYGSVGVIFQYSYSHDNSEGIYWGCNTRGLANNTSGIPDPEDVGCTLRYCISQNDMGDLIFFNYPSAGNEIYNNVFYIKAGLSSKIIHESSSKNHTYNFFNNIIYDAGNARYDWGTGGVGIQNRNFKNNIFFGIPLESQIVDNQVSTNDPLFVSVGTATTGLSSVTGYKLNTNSPALNSGVLVPNNGLKDYFGNVVSSALAPNRGFFNGFNTLPVSLINFYGTAALQGVFLTWQTISETNNQFFNIERSTDGKIFTVVGTVKGAINSSRQLSYSFTDKMPFNGLNYYRLVQYDTNGKSSNSNILVILFNSIADDHQFKIKLYPNPAKELLNIKLSGAATPKQVLISLYSLEGKKISSGNILKADEQFSLNVESLKLGIYLLEIKDLQTNKLLGTSKFIKTN